MVGVMRGHLESTSICKVRYVLHSCIKKSTARKKPTTGTRRLIKSQDFRQNYLCDFYLRLDVSMYPVFCTALTDDYEVTLSFLAFLLGS
jgi:hypothetical protein